ncbi:transcriptional regulator [Microbacterium sp. MYb62]|uniref:transcriptional regulator n=1 Tax=Microbacterium sp. MYb62 TaxID=1848690 RepID=UPI000CFB7990|nr:transcriptional regulator [Microbacterium sp. MYb62]PRB19103.1 ArsR family transcriptional regulator [Microbacterium sp. MYb62]
MRSAAERTGRVRLDDTFAASLPFSLMAALQNGADLEFRTLRRVLDCEGRSLSGAIGQLQRVGYVFARRVSFGEVPGTWISATPRGRVAFDDHLAALREIASDAPPSR